LGLVLQLELSDDRCCELDRRLNNSIGWNVSPLENVPNPIRRVLKGTVKAPDGEICWGECHADNARQRTTNFPCCGAKGILIHHDGQFVGWRGLRRTTRSSQP